MSNGDEDARYIQVATITQRSTVLVEAVIRGGTEKQRQADADRITRWLTELQHKRKAHFIAFANIIIGDDSVVVTATVNGENAAERTRAAKKVVSHLHQKFDERGQLRVVH